MRVSRRRFSVAIASTVILGQVGCATFPGTMKDKAASDVSSDSEKTSLLDRMPWSKKKEEAPKAYPSPVKMAATWTPDTLVQSGRTPTRGFGARIFFYDERSRPVPVDGTLVIHGVDESAPTPQEGVKRFEFTPEQFTRHFSQCDLGASYSVWLPWDAVGGDQKRISLVASFVSSDGKPVQATPSVVVLPGSKTETAETELLAKYSPQYRDHLNAIASGTSPSSGLTTTTIQRGSRPEGAKQATPPASGFGDVKSMLAGKSSTPAVDLKIARQPKSQTVLPASAELPTKRARPSMFRR